MILLMAILRIMMPMVVLRVVVVVVVVLVVVARRQKEKEEKYPSREITTCFILLTITGGRVWQYEPATR